MAEDFCSDRREMAEATDEHNDLMITFSVSITLLCFQRLHVFANVRNLQALSRKTNASSRFRLSEQPARFLSHLNCIVHSDRPRLPQCPPVRLLLGFRLGFGFLLLATELKEGWSFLCCSSFQVRPIGRSSGTLPMR